VGFIDPWGLYEQDVHLYLTRQLAVNAGFSPQQASTIARADQGMDDSIFTWPWNPLGGTQMHFMTHDYARVGLQQAVYRGDLMYFGQFLHALQDSYSHEGFKWYLGGHIPAGHAPDKYCATSAKDKAMREETTMWLKRFKSRLDMGQVSR
jgi:hypothetical protein